MIRGFLDTLAITHSDGLLDEIPPQPAAASLAAAIDGLFAANPAVAVKVYLHVFQPLDAEAWPDLDRLLASDPRLAFPPTA